MKERGKAVETYEYDVNNHSDFNYSISDMPCKKHPASSSVGICAYCLKDRLVNLVCSDCGEQRLSSCSCSDISSSYRNSCAGEVGSVGRISFLIENEKTEPPQQPPYSRPKINGDQKPEEVIVLRRSSSSCVEIKKNSNGFWKIKRLFRRKRNKGCDQKDNYDQEDNKSDWVSDIMGVSRSRSLCSFRGGGFNDPDEGSERAYSSAKISDVTGGIFWDPERQCGYGEAEPPRRSGFRGVLDGGEHGLDYNKGIKKGGGTLMELDRTYSVQHRSVFPVKESDFSAMDESAFIDLKLDLSSSESKQDFSAARISGASDHGGGGFRGEANYELAAGGLKSNIGLFGNNIGGVGGSSCRVTVNDNGAWLKRGGKGRKVWKWIFKHHPNWRNASKKDHEVRLTS